MTPEEMKRRSRGFSTDMSGEAVARRIEIVSQLREMGLALKKAKILEKPPPQSHNIKE
ncbi:MAG: hypothetical protein JJU11_05075 [Candidatus Sumerlaeia bacterium]|nr:hypothetical protein [Candidatus Sumerlaeia bacterium]